RGIEILKQAGIEVEIGLCSEEVSEFLTPYLGKS
ncbi:diaminohydroxyphosphoribosylaminopyrimidine deaminase domain protein, partial [Vibrio parahaemolyticus V-223/04]